MVKEISRDWRDVPPRCVIGKFQPSLLFYEREDEISQTSSSNSISNIFSPPKQLESKVSASIDAFAEREATTYASSFSRRTSSDSLPNDPKKHAKMNNLSQKDSLTHNGTSIPTREYIRFSDSSPTPSTSNSSILSDPLLPTAPKSSSPVSTTGVKNYTNQPKSTSSPSPPPTTGAKDLNTETPLSYTAPTDSYGYFSNHSISYTSKAADNSKSAPPESSIKSLKRTNSLLDSTSNDVRKIQEESSATISNFIGWADKSPSVNERVQHLEANARYFNN